MGTWVRKVWTFRLGGKGVPGRERSVLPGEIVKRVDPTDGTKVGEYSDKRRSRSGVPVESH